MTEADDTTADAPDTRPAYPRIRLEYEDALYQLDGALACVELIARLIANDPEETTPDEAAALVFAVKGARAAAAALDRFTLRLPAQEAGHA